MPPCIETKLMSPVDEDSSLLLKARERDLLAIIAAKDKQIQQLEQKLEAQSAFIDAVLKLSDQYRAPPAVKVNRRVSWCPSVDQLEQLPPQVVTTGNNSATKEEVPVNSVPGSSNQEIDVAKLLDDIEDDVSVLSSDDDNNNNNNNQSAGAKVKKDVEEIYLDQVVDTNDTMALSKLMIVEDEEGEVDPDAISAARAAMTSDGEVDIDTIAASRARQLEGLKIAANYSKQSGKTSSGIIDIDDLSASKAKVFETKIAAARSRYSGEADTESEEEEEGKPRKIRPSKAERRVVQHIIERIRNDDDSVDV